MKLELTHISESILLSVSQGRCPVQTSPQSLLQCKTMSSSLVIFTFLITSDVWHGVRKQRLVTDFFWGRFIECFYHLWISVRGRCTSMGSKCVRRVWWMVRWTWRGAGREKGSVWGISLEWPHCIYFSLEWPLHIFWRRNQFYRTQVNLACPSQYVV